MTSETRKGFKENIQVNGSENKWCGQKGKKAEQKNHKCTTEECFNKPKNWIAPVCPVSDVLKGQYIRLYQALCNKRLENKAQ